jgi:hypothetical protein
MNRKYAILLFIIPLIAVVAVGVFSGNVYPFGHFKNTGNSVIGGSVRDCNFCHDFDNGVYDYPLPPNKNLRWVKTAIKFCSTNRNRACIDDTDCPAGETCTFERTVKFTTFTGTDGTLADGNTALLDGPCEVCHTQLGHHNNTSSGDHEHYKGQDCTVCHPHFADDITEYFIPVFAGGQSHETHIGKYVGGVHVDDPKGPAIGANNCTYNLGGCHAHGDFTRFGSESAPLSTTTVCDTCHSQGGAFNGVADAKANWVDAIYKEPLDPNDWPSEIQNGKEGWCLGCHDNAPAVIDGISAPNVAGNNVTYGYNVTGHGIYGNPAVTCAGPLPFGCHATISKFCSINKSRACLVDTDCPTGERCNYASHTDGNAQTYAASLNNYQSGFRLAENMGIPRTNQYGPAAFKLCFSCHGSTPFITETSAATDFRDDTKSDPNGVRPWNFHWEHLKQDYNDHPSWDSDYDWTSNDCSHFSVCSDSALSCTACHNVHGSPCIQGTSIVACTDPVKNPMIRHGELISTSTYSRVPAFQFHWYSQTGNSVTDWNSSRTGGLRCEDPFQINGGVFSNHVCWGCHAPGEKTYYRAPGGPDGVTILYVQATDYSDNVPIPDEFSRSADIRYRVKFKSKGPASSYCVKAAGNMKDSAGTKKTFNHSEVLSSNNDIHDWTWDKTVPVGAATGEATLTITVNMYSAAGACPPPAGTTVIYTEKQSDTFGIIP